MSIRTEYRGVDLEKEMDRLASIQEQFPKLLRGIAAVLEAQTRKNFDDETSPSGKAWKPSQRKIKKGGKTLTKDGHLADSINSYVEGNSVYVGTARSYALTHQLGRSFSVNVGAHTRTTTILFGKKVAPYKQTFPAHTKKVRIPIRAFLPRTDKEIDWDSILVIIDKVMGKEST